MAFRTKLEMFLSIMLTFLTNVIFSNLIITFLHGCQNKVGDVVSGARREPVLDEHPRRNPAHQHPDHVLQAAAQPRRLHQAARGQ